MHRRGVEKDLPLQTNDRRQHLKIAISALSDRVETLEYVLCYREKEFI